MDYLTLLAARYITPTRRRYAWLAGAMLWAGWLLSIGLGSDVLDLAGQVVGTDYLEFYAAGTTVRSGASARLYDVAYQTQLQQAIIGPQLRHYYGFITPPFLAWLFAPLSALPYVWSFALWSACGLAALWLSLRLLAVPDPRRAGLWALTFFPVFATISFGQNSLLSLLLLSLVYRLWRRGQGWAAGLTASLLLYKPQLILGVALLWLLEWLWPAANEPSDGAAALAAENVIARSVACDEAISPDAKDCFGPNSGPRNDASETIYRADVHVGNDATAHENKPICDPLRHLRIILRTNLAALLGLGVGGGLLIGICLWQLPAASHAYLTFARTVLPDLPAYQDFPLWNLHTVWGFWRLLLPHHEAWADALYGVSAILGLTGFIFFWHRHRVRSDLTFAAAICVTLWVTPHAMIYDWTLLLIPALLLWQAAPEQRNHWTALFALLWLVAFVSGPLTRAQLSVLPIALQISVPVLLAALWLAGRQLYNPSTRPTAE